MLLIRPTHKLRKEIGSSIALVDKATSARFFFGSWHANLLVINRRKCLLFTNDDSLIHFLIPGVKRAELQNLAPLFQVHLRDFLIRERIPKEAIEFILQECNELRIGDKTDRSVLGSMTDIAWNYKEMILDQGGIEAADLSSTIHELNRMPMNLIKMRLPINAFRELLRKEMIR